MTQDVKLIHKHLGSKEELPPRFSSKQCNYKAKVDLSNST